MANLGSGDQLKVDPKITTANAKNIFKEGSLKKQQQSIDDARSDSPSTVDESGKTLKQRLEALAGSSWPHKQNGYLDFTLITPTLTTTGNPTNPDKPLPVKMAYSEDYKFKDWRGQILSEGPKWPKNIIKTEDRFKASRNLPKSKKSLNTSPHSMRDVPLIFNDTRYDYFRFGLQTLDNLNPIENPKNGRSSLRLDTSKGTPWEQNDPVYYGFDIIFDSVSSPLLNGAVSDFINNYSNISEIGSKKQVYEEFKNQFIKFFRTNSTVKVDPDYIRMTSTGITPAKLDENTSLNQPGKSAYFAYYIKKIGGLNLLVESNRGDTMKYISDYRKDMITIDMSEDITLSLGTLSHLYKLLYWSKPNGKALIPDNLLRFNCDIIISECRNMNRVRKDISTGNIEVVKDNLSRWVYSLRDCQFFFDKMTHEESIDMGAEPKAFETNSIAFDFKFSSVALERFVPVFNSDSNWGSYYSYNGGSIWKIGNVGTRDNRNTGSSQENSTPKFFDMDLNSSNQNGVKTPYVIASYGDHSKYESRSTSNSLDIFKNQSDINSNSISSQILNDKIENAASNLKPGQNLAKALSSSSFNKTKDKTNDVSSTKVNKTSNFSISSRFFDVNGSLKGNSPITLSVGKANIISAFPNSSGFFDVNGSLMGNNPITQRQNLINTTISKLYNNKREGIMANKLNDDAKKGIKNYASNGFGWDINGYKPPVPFRSSLNSLAGPNAQANIKYISKMNPPVKFSLSKSKGYESPGDLYVFQIKDFLGQTLSDKIFKQNGF